MSSYFTSIPKSLIVLNIFFCILLALWFLFGDQTGDLVVFTGVFLDLLICIQNNKDEDRERS